MKKNSVLLVLMATVLSTIVAGCGGGGGGGGSTSGTLNSQIVQGIVSAPSGTLSSNAVLSSKATTTGNGITPVANVTVTVGTITVTGGVTATFTAIDGATATTAADGTFSITLPAGTTLTPNLVVIAYTGTMPATLPAAGVLVCPVVHSKLSVDPATTVATENLCQEAASNGIDVGDMDKDLVKNYLLAVENAAGNTTSSTLTDTFNAIKIKVSTDSSSTITISGVVLDVQRRHHKPTVSGTMTSGAAFTTGTDSNSAAFNGNSTEFTATVVAALPHHDRVVLMGQTVPTSSSSTVRRFTVSIPITGGVLTAGTYTADAFYSEETFNGNPVPPTPPTPPSPPMNSRSSGMSGIGFFDDGTVSVWGAKSVNVTVTAGTSTSTNTGATYNFTVDSATYSPVISDDAIGNAKGTLTTGLTGTVTVQ